MALENANVLIELQERKTELEKNIQELNLQLQSTSNILMRVGGAIEVLEQIEASKSVEEVVDEVIDEDGEEDA